jgi:acetyl esterase/lipase
MFTSGSNREQIVIICILLQLCTSNCFGQRTDHKSIFQQDTSFNIRSEFQKQVRQFPQITIAMPDTTQLVIRKDLVYKRYGKRSLHLDLFISKDTKHRQPAVIFIHGGGWRSGNRTMDWPMAAALAKRGYATLCVEYRLSTEALYPAAVMDIQSAVLWVSRHASDYGIDADKITLAGTSSGGQLAALAGTLNGAVSFPGTLMKKRLQKEIRAVVDIDGVLAFIHPESGEGVDKPGKPSAATLWLGASKEQRPDIWYQASPLTHVNDHSAPILFINSSIPRFHAGRSDFIQKLDSLRIYSEIHTIDDTPHTFWLFHPWFNQSIEIMDCFLRKIFFQKM